MFDQLRLRILERLELCAYHGICDATHVLFQRQALETDITGDALPYGRLNFSEHLQAPVRIGVKGSSKRHEVSAAGSQHMLRIGRLDHPARRQHRYAKRLLDRTRIIRKIRPGKGRRLYAMLGQPGAFIAAARKVDGMHTGALHSLGKLDDLRFRIAAFRELADTQAYDQVQGRQGSRSMVSSGKRMRFSIDPPYSSVRLLMRGLKNC